MSQNLTNNQDSNDSSNGVTPNKSSEDNAGQNQNQDNSADLENMKKALSSERSFKKALEKETQELKDQYSELETESAKKIEELENQVAQMKAEKENSELNNLKLNKAVEAGIPLDAVDFITAKNEKEIVEQIEKFKKLTAHTEEDLQQQKRKAPEPNQVFGNKDISNTNNAAIVGSFVRDQLGR